ISVPIGTIIGSQNMAVPTATPASVLVPWRPAMTLSTKPISPVARWPATSGAASTAVVRTSLRKRGGGGDAGMVAARDDCGRQRSDVARWRRVDGGRYFRRYDAPRRGPGRAWPDARNSRRCRNADDDPDRPAGALAARTPRPRPGARRLRQLRHAAAGRALLRLRTAGEGAGPAFLQPGRRRARQRVRMGWTHAAHALAAVRTPGL